MSIFVIDQSPELSWFVNNALVEEEILIKHFQTLEASEEIILQELPKIVILNGDNKTYPPEKFITKMRNHVFARNTMFIVFTSDTSEEFKKTLLVSGAAQILYQGKGFSPSPKFFASIVKWCLSIKSPNPGLFDYSPVEFKAMGELTSYGRLGWMSPTECMIETNIELSVGQSMSFQNSIIEELGIKETRLECLERDKVGRYYQYAHSLRCKIISKNPDKDSKLIENWLQNNSQISKHKPIKVVYFDSEPLYRETIKQTIKVDKRYCARGYASLENINELLDYQMPHLILINRLLVTEDPISFAKIKDFMKSHFCYCVTYSTGEDHDIEDFQKKYDFAIHSPSTVDLPLLESMIKKLEEKLPAELATDDKKVYFNKYSIHSRISFHSPVQLTELAVTGCGMILPFPISNFGACDISSSSFGMASINHKQFFRIFGSQSGSKGIYHKMIFMGQNIKDNNHVRQAVGQIQVVGYERWLQGDIEKE